MHLPNNSSNTKAFSHPSAKRSANSGSVIKTSFSPITSSPSDQTASASTTKTTQIPPLTSLRFPRAASTAANCTVSCALGSYQIPLGANQYPDFLRNFMKSWLACRSNRTRWRSSLTWVESSVGSRFVWSQGFVLWPIFLPRGRCCWIFFRFYGVSFCGWCFLGLLFLWGVFLGGGIPLTFVGGGVCHLHVLYPL